MSDPAWLSASDTDLHDFVLDTAEDEAGFDRSVAVGPLTGLWELGAMALQYAWRVAIRPIANSIDPHTASLWYLRKFGVGAGVPWRAAPRATKGFVTITSATGGTLAAGTEVLAGGQVYTTDTEAILAAGVPLAVEVTASVGGAAGNVGAGSAVEFTSEVSPADATGELRAHWVTVIGFDADTDDEDGVEVYRRRVVAGLGVRGEANTEARYRFFSYQVPGVSDVRMARTPREYGSTDLSFLVRGDLPSANDIELVETAMANARLVCRDLWVRAPRVVPVAVTATVRGTATVSAVEATILAWWRRNIGIGDDVLIEQLYDSTDGLEGLENIEYQSPIANIDGAVPTWYSPSITVTPEVPA